MIGLRTAALVAALGVSMLLLRQRRRSRIAQVAPTMLTVTSQSATRRRRRRHGAELCLLLVVVEVLIGVVAYRLFFTNVDDPSPLSVLTLVPDGAPDPNLILRLTVRPDHQVNGVMSLGRSFEWPVAFEAAPGVHNVTVEPAQVTRDSGFASMARHAGFTKLAQPTQSNGLAINFLARSADRNYAERVLVIEPGPLSRASGHGISYPLNAITVVFEGDETLTSVPEGASVRRLAGATGPKQYVEMKLGSYNEIPQPLVFRWTDEAARSQREFLLVIAAVVAGGLAGILAEILVKIALD